MINREESIALANQASGYMAIQDEMKRDKLVEDLEYNLFRLLKPKVSMDGNQWSVLLGNNMMEGVCGFGDTLYLAILDFNKSFHSIIEFEKNKKTV